MTTLFCSALSLTVVLRVCVCTKRVCVCYKELVCKAVQLAFSCQTCAISILFIFVPCFYQPKCSTHCWSVVHVQKKNLPKFTMTKKVFFHSPKCTFKPDPICQYLCFFLSFFFSGNWGADQNEYILKYNNIE